MKPRAILHGEIVEGLYGRCAVCREWLKSETEATRHEHRGDPRSVYAEDGAPRVVLRPRGIGPEDEP